MRQECSIRITILYPSTFELYKMAEYDFIVVGGGIGGCVVASRLSTCQEGFRVLLVEAGKDVSDRREILTGPWAPHLTTDLDWGYKTTPQPHLNNRQITINAGKGVGGGSILNACKNAVLFMDAAD